jgi:UDP-N-acetylmuramoyl-tripeptide--D-alanyl-D-alanine ligase
VKIELGVLAELLGGTLHGDASDTVIGFATDSRDAGPGYAFLAIHGERVDGHDYVETARERGAVVAIVEKAVVGPYILVDDLVAALAKMAARFRAVFGGPVIGITGSAGKTTVKEFVAAALSPLGPVLKTPGNRNTELTVPLVWAEVTAEHRSAVIEMAMRGFGQIAHLAKFSQPEIGVVTNIGYSHLEMVGSRLGIARAKAELLEALPSSGAAILWAEDEYLEPLRKSTAAAVQTFGFSPWAESRIESYQALSWRQSQVAGVTNGVSWEATLPAVGRHMALGAAAAILVAQRCGVDLAEASSALASATLPPMRMEVREIAGVTYLVDAYNASPSSMIAALETVSETPGTGRRRAVLGEMRELGEASEEAHRSIGDALSRFGVDDVIFFGEPMRSAMSAYGSGRFAEDIDEVRSFVEESLPGDVVLVKGSRSLELERALP